jgi:type I restriction enzyme S subunit
MRDGWKEISLEDLETSGVIKLGRGDVISKKDMEADPGANPVYSSAENKNGMIGKYAKFMFDEELITWSVDGGGHIFYRPKHKFSVTNIGGWLRILDDKVFSYQFLTFALQRLHKQHTFDWQHKAHPSVIRKLYTRILMPSLPEQKRIVDLISSVDSYIQALQQQLDNAKNSKSAYVSTVIVEMFGRGKKVKIADIAEVKGGKRLPKGTPWSEEPTEHRYIRATDIKGGIILTENLVYVPDYVWPTISRYIVNEGDIVITIAGTIGEVGVVPGNLDGVNLTENAAKIVVDRKFVNSSYLAMLLGSSYYQQDIDSKTKKTTQPKLGLNMINSIEIPLPDLVEQNKIFSVVTQIDSVIASTQNLISRTVGLRSGLLADLLSGEHEIPTSYDKVMGAA